jgi:hypothetical protein
VSDNNMIGLRDKNPEILLYKEVLSNEQPKDTVVIDLSTKVLKEREQKEVQSIRCLTKRQAYCVNAAIALTCQIVQSIVNRVTNNNSIEGEHGSDGPELMEDMAFAHFINKMVKGNWEEVGSVAQQCLVLLGYVASGIGMDALLLKTLETESEQTSVIGKCATFSLVNSIGYLSAMAIAAIMQKRTYLGGEPPIRGEPSNINCRRAGSCALVLATAFAAATTNRLLINASSTSGVVLNIICNEVVNKLFKTGQKSENETGRKIKLLSGYTFLTIAADVIVGSLLSQGLLSTNPWRYFGVTTVGALFSFSRVALKVLSDHEPQTKKASSVKIEELPSEAPKEEGEHAIMASDKSELEMVQVVQALPKTQESTEDQSTETLKIDDSSTLVNEEKKPSSWTWGGLLAKVSAVTTPVIATVLNHVSTVKDSSGLSMAVKFLQHNANYLTIRELYKKAVGPVQRIATAVVPVAIAASVDFVANQIDPTRRNWNTTGMAIATGASYLGMSVSGMLMKGDGDTDDS